MAWKIPLSDIDMGSDEIAAVTRVLESRWLTMGAVTQEFEEKFAVLTGAKHALAVTNATAALHLACVVAGLGPGDEVIVPSLTFVATANAIRYVGATPVFADICGEDDLNISPESIQKNLTARTKAIIIVHYAGYACDMSNIMRIAEENNLKVIEDAAHASGASLNGKALGTFGQTGCFSFFSNKNMTTGEGGMLTTQDDAIAERLRALRSHGMTSMTWDRHKGHAWSYDVTDLGYNYRIDEIRSAIGLVQLGKLPANNLRRKALTELYREVLAEVSPVVTMPFASSKGQSAYHIMPILLPEGTDRLKFMDEMKEEGIQTSIHYPPIHTFQAFRAAEYPYQGLTVTEKIASREVTLPLYPGMTDENVMLVAEAAGRALDSLKKYIIKVYPTRPQMPSPMCTALVAFFIEWKTAICARGYYKCERMLSILFVCTANQFRSPLAAASLMSYLERKGTASNWVVASAGTWAKPGLPALSVTIKNAERLGLQGLIKHRSRTVSEELLEAFDLIVVMEKGHKEALNAEFRSARDRIFMLSEVTDGVQVDVPDPIMLGTNADESATELHNQIDAGADKILNLAEILSVKRK